MVSVLSDWLKSRLSLDRGGGLALRHLPEVDHSQHHGQGRIQLVADDFDERSFDTVCLNKLGVRFLKLTQQRVLLDDQLVVLDRLPHDGGKKIGVARLGDISEDVALVDGFDDRVEIGIGREQ
jgi:hypothetical protein